MKRTRSSIRGLLRSALIRLCLGVFLLAPAVTLPPPAVSATSAPPVATPAAGLLSFTAGGHVLGFDADGVYVASGSHLLKVDFVGTPGVVPMSYSDPDRRGLEDRVGLAGAPALGKVAYPSLWPSLWPGVSLTYQSTDAGIAKSTYFVEPGGRVEDIRLRYNAPVELAGDGSLVFAFETGEMREGAPVAWQEIGGERIGVEVAFRLLDEREVGFAAAGYDARYPLVVDPTLAWHTFLGGSGSDLSYAIAVDGSGNVYVAGYSSATWGSPLRSYASGNDAFAAKLSPADAYSDPAGVCGSNTPCFTTLTATLSAVDIGKTAYIYGGTYTESLSISTNVTATLSATVSITGSVSLTTGTLNTNGYTLTVSGDWTNSGGTYTANSGRVIFDKAGTTTLSKSGAGSAETFCNLTISRTTTILDVSDDYLAITGGCALTNNGAIRREAPAQNATTNTRLTYNDPISYTTVVMTSTGGTALGSTAITVTIGQTPSSCNGNAFGGTPVKRFYEVTPSSTSGVSGTLRLYYAPGEANGTTASNVNLFRCGSSGPWMQVAGTAVRGTDENGNRYLEVANVTTFSPFTLGEGSTTGVEVSSLSARALSSGIEVTWETASELSITGFNLWRAEGAGEEWGKVNGVPIAAEGASWGNRYKYVDSTTRPGRRYLYRLEALGLLGGSEWYGPVSGSRGWTVFLPWVGN